MEAVCESRKARNQGIKVNTVMLSAYDKGQAAYAIGQTDEDCPYPSRQSKGSSTYRIEWFNGFLDARTADKLGHIFNKKKEEVETDD